jgi:probable rRNA maturation factor
MIEVINRQRKYRINKHRFKILLERLVEHYSLNDPEITLAFVNNTRIQKLNKEFLGENRPTDVLSFPIGEKGADGKFYLGDIIISVHKAFQQSAVKEHELEKELEHLTIHGFLHLVGFVHDKGMEEEEEMIRKAIIEDRHGR